MKIFQDWLQIADDMAVLLTVAEEPEGRAVSVRLIPDPTKEKSTQTTLDQAYENMMRSFGLELPKPPAPPVTSRVIYGPGVMFMSKDAELLAARLLEVSEALKYFAQKIHCPQEIFSGLGESIRQ